MCGMLLSRMLQKSMTSSSKLERKTTSRKERKYTFATVA